MLMNSTTITPPVAANSADWRYVEAGLVDGSVGAPVVLMNPTMQKTNSITITMTPVGANCADCGNNYYMLI